MRKIVIIPGGFHPYHAGHHSLYNSAKKAFPGADVYVAATNDTKTRPFPFAIKEKLAKLAGVADKHFVQVKSPFQPREITDHYNPEEDVLIFVRSEKDRNESPKPGGTKKDGTPAYFQPWTGKNVQPFGKQAYIAYLPTVEFGPGITSATEIRNAWPTLNDKRKTAMVMSLYPATQKNPKLAANVVKMLDMGMGGQEGVAEGKLEELTNASLKVKQPKDFVNTNDRKQVTWKVMKFKSGKDTYLINFTMQHPPAFDKKSKSNWNAVNVAFGVKEPQDEYSFGDEINTDLTAKNKNQFLIYSTVINAVRKFITEYNTEIDEIIMQGAGERQQALYQRFFQSAGKYFPGWHYNGKHSLVRDVPRQTGKKVQEQGVAEGSLNEFVPPSSDRGEGGNDRSRRIRKLLEIAIQVAKEKNVDELGMIHAMNMIAGDEFFNTAVEGILPDITDKEYMFVLQSAYKTVKQGLAEAKKKRKKKSKNRSIGRYFFPGYSYYGGSGESGESGGDGGGEGMAEGDVVPFKQPSKTLTWDQVPKDILMLANDWFWASEDNSGLAATIDPEGFGNGTANDVKYLTAKLQQKGWTIDFNDEYDGPGEFNLRLTNKRGQTVLLSIEDAQSFTGWAKGTSQYDLEEADVTKNADYLEEK